MRALGYLYKKTVSNPGCINAPQVVDVYSLSGCVTENFADYIQYWKHNGFWLFDTPAIVEELALEQSISLVGMKLFYYEAYEEEYDETKRIWSSFQAEHGFVTNVVPPMTKKREGYDVVTYSCGTSPECSPLACNALAESISTNEHCLFETFDEARQAIESGKFDGSEPGPFRIIAVYSVSDA